MATHGCEGRKHDRMRSFRCRSGSKRSRTTRTSEEVYNTERHLLYVACTRARDHLLVTSVDPASEFREDLRA
jgi:ATP-dependent exoDNAse (exonuclease V) beta subunit